MSERHAELLSEAALWAQERSSDDTRFRALGSTELKAASGRRPASLEELLPTGGRPECCPSAGVDALPRSQGGLGREGRVPFPDRMRSLLYYPGNSAQTPLEPVRPVLLLEKQHIPSESLLDWRRIPLFRAPESAARFTVGLIPGPCRPEREKLSEADRK